MTHSDNEPKFRQYNGSPPDYRAYHEVSITRDLGAQRNDEIIAFIGNHIAEYKGHTEDKHGLPLMLFERKQDAQKFANELMVRLDLQKEHVAVKAQKFTR
ncbi:MAG: hypothetical protein PHE50_09695 [Dehalococcoidales bacterium]|nr:hypothetical protein [Dehalococcoidales bacterium]